jgi:hypothetical protein
MHVDKQCNEVFFFFGCVIHMKIVVFPISLVYVLWDLDFAFMQKKNFQPWANEKKKHCYPHIELRFCRLKVNTW